MFDRMKNNGGKDLLGKVNRIAEGSKIKGDISSIADFRLDGELIGNFISSGKLVIGEKGRLVGDISCENMDVDGYYEGKAEVKGLLTVKPKGKIKGEVFVGKLAVEQGAQFMAVCQMKGTVKTIVQQQPNEQSKQEKAI